ncbi:MAG: zinc ribbon domain-containing protein [Actinomycetota bacterium]|nr:zinc ribbon domain-containing protein [Actinomycetota bacterium]
MDRTEKNEDVTAPGSCPECGYSENPLGNRFCGRCGASLERSPARRGELVPRAEESRVTLRERLLPDRLGPVGRTVAVGLAAVAVNVSLAWLRHRLEKTDRTMLLHDAGRVWREEGSGDGTEYLHGYLLEEAVLLLREGRKTRGWFSSELTIRSSRIEK